MWLESSEDLRVWPLPPNLYAIRYGEDMKDAALVTTVGVEGEDESAVDRLAMWVREQARRRGARTVVVSEPHSRRVPKLISRRPEPVSQTYCYAAFLSI